MGEKVMANKQALPNGLLSANIGAIDSPAPNKVVAPEWKEQKWATVAKVADSVVKMSAGYKDMKHMEMLAKLDNVQQQNLHALGDATDPCQLPELVKQANQSYAEMFKDDPYGKSFYESEAYKKFKTSNEFKVNQEVIKMNHKFDVIQATKTGNELSSDIALMTDTTRMSNALSTYDMTLKQMGLTPDERFKLMSSVVQDSFGKVFANNPNTAVAWYNASQGAYDQYGLNGADIKDKADKWNKAQRAEQRAIENYEHTKKTREIEAKTNQYKAKIIQFPDQADTILAKAMVEDNKMYVDLVKFVEDRTPKSTKRSALSKEAVRVYSEEGLEGLEKYIENNPETLNDPNTMNFLENAKKINKEDDSTLEEMEKAFENGTYPEYRTNNLAKILSKSELRGTDEAYRKSLDISGNADSYSLRIANADTVEEVEEIAKEALNDDLLSDKEQLTVAKYKNTRISQLENKADKVQNKQEKATKEKIKDDSTKAYGEILLEEPNGSDAVSKKIIEKASLLIPEDKNKAIALYNRVAKAENKEQKDLSKELQEVKYNELMGKYRDGNLTQEDIDTAYENGDISIKHKEKLENTLYKSEIANAKEEKEKAKEEALKIVYTADANGETVNVSALPSNDSDVLKAANQVNLKNAKNKYYKTENEVFAEILANPTPTKEQMDGWRNKLIENDFMGNTRSPDEFITDSFNKIRGLGEKQIRSAKNKIDTMFGYPLKGSKFSDYEIEQKNLAYQDAITALIDGKEPNYDEIISNRKPTMEGLNLYYQNKDNAYYSSLSMRDSLFQVKEVKEEKGGVVTKSKSYTLNPSYKFSDFNSYVDGLEEKKQLLSDSEYKELYKPIAMYLGDILATAKKDDSVQAYALNQLRDFMYGKGNPIDTPVTFYEEYRKIMAVVEEKVADRNKSADPWGWNNYKSAIDEVIMSYMQNGQQLTGYKGR
jgi:hypothetical protein